MISIVIPTCTQKLVKSCVDSIIKYTDMSNIELVVVANGAEAETKDIALPDGGKLIWFDERIGATRALNEGIKASTGEYIILLNDDVELLEQEKDVWIDMLSQPFKNNQKVGITGPLRIESQEIKQDFIIFFCVMIKKIMFEEIGLLDETLQCGCDMDFSIRVKNHGYSIVQVPDVSLNENTDSKFWTGGFPVYHAAEKTVLSVYSREEWDKIFQEDTSMLIKKYGPKTLNEKKFSIVIPTCKTENLHQVISSINTNTDLSHGEVIIVANGAIEDAKSFVYHLGDSFKLIWFDERIGATRALNEGIKASTGEYVILLNDDVTILSNDWIPMLLNPFIDENVGVTGPINGNHSVFNRKFVMAFCCAIRRKVFDQVGLLDEIFSPGGYEDVDFSFKAEDAGWKLLQVPDDSELAYNGEVLVGGFPIWHASGDTVSTSKNWQEIQVRNSQIINDRYNKVIKIDWPCAQKTKELYMLQNFLKEHKIERVLEIGSYRGGTAMLWAKIVHPNNGKVFCLDLRFNWDAFWEPNFMHDGQVYKKSSLKDIVTEFEGDSHSIEMKEKVSKEVGQVDLLFIDGDHSYEGVKDDFYSYSKLVKPGGFVVFHDIVDSPYHWSFDCHVSTFWEEIKHGYEYREFIDTGEYPGSPGQSMGIGILKMKDESIINDEKNKIGIVVPVYNGEKYICKAIESILNQTFQNWLLFIVDDCSTDKTYEICRSYAEKDSRISLFRQEINAGTSQARNRALNKILNNTSIGFVAYCDADDIWEPEHLTMGMKFLNDADMVYSDVKVVFEDGSNAIPFGISYYDSFDGEKLKLGNYIYISTVIHKVECLKIGEFDPELNSIEDWDFWLRIYEDGFKIVHNPIIDAVYLVRPNGNASRRTDAIFARFQKKHFLVDDGEGAIKLNIACGDQVLPGYINLDLYNPKADVKGDVRHLPFDDNYADEILASHIIEHFTFKEGFVVLEEWERVLKPGGKLIIECPDFMALCRLFVDGDEQERLLLYNGFYGAIEGEGMLHKFGYTPTQMRWTLGQLSFTNIQQGEPTFYPESKRMNMRFECQK